MPEPLGIVKLTSEVNPTDDHVVLHVECDNGTRGWVAMRYFDELARRGLCLSKTHSWFLVEDSQGFTVLCCEPKE